MPLSTTDGNADYDADRVVDVELQARREELALGVSRYIVRVCVAVSVLLVGVWLLILPYPQVFIYAVLLILMAVGAGLYPVFQRRNRVMTGLYLVNGLSLILILLSPLLIPGLLPVIGVTDVVAIIITIMLLGDRGSRWLVAAFALAYMVDVAVVAILGWSPFPPLDYTIELWITGSISLVVIVTAILIIRLIVLGQEQQFRRAQRLNLELEWQIQATNETKETLKRERNLLRLLIDTVPANVYIKDTQSRFVDANLETARQMGQKTPNDLIGKTDFDFFIPELAEKYFKDEQAIIQSKLPLRSFEESNFDHRTQQNSWFLTTKAPILNEQGDVTGIVGVGLDITARTSAQEQVARERDLLRTLIDNIPDYIFVKDAAGLFVNSNAAHNQISHVKDAAQLRGKSVFDLFPPHLAVQYLADDQQVLQTGQALVNVERTSLDVEGHERTVLTTKVPLRDESGQIIGLVGISRDITEHKQAEQALQAKTEQERLFQTSLKPLYDITIELTQINGLDDFYRSVVEMALERLGFDRFGLLLYDQEQVRVTGTYGTDANGKIIPEYDLSFDPADLTGILKQMQETTEQFALNENTELFDNAEPIGFGWNAAAMLWNGEQSLGWLLTDNAVHHQPVSKPLLDILALYAQTVGTLLGRKRVEQALRENEAKLQTFFEVLPVGVAVLDANGQIIDMNPALERILDIPMEEFLSGSYRNRKYISSDGKLIGFDDLPSTRAQVERQPIHNMEIGVIKEDNQTIWTSVSAALLQGANPGVMIVTADITERKLAEAQTIALAAEQQRVKVLHQFIGDATHDLMTPISGINTSAYLARKAPDQEHLTEHLDKIETLSEKLQKMLQDMLTMSKLDMMTPADLELHTIKLDQLLMRLVATYRARAQAKEQQLSGETESQIGTLQADDIYLFMALAMIVENAIHYTPNGGTVHISITSTESQVTLTVQDSGIGIASDDLPHIFERFYRAKSYRPMDSGAGLGLSIAQRIIELHSGRVEVTSEVDSGSTFRVLLPSN